MQFTQKNGANNNSTPGIYQIFHQGETVKHPYAILGHLLAATCVTIWGTTFISTKVLLEHGLQPAQIFLIRFTLAYICLIPFVHKPLWSRNWRDEVRFMLLGLGGGSLYFLTENMALKYSPTTNVSLLVCTSPLLTTIAISLLYRSERMNLKQIAGSLIALVGMSLVVLNGQFSLHLSPLGDMLALMAALMWMVYSIVIRGLGDRYSSLFITRKTFFWGLATILPWFIWRHEELDFKALWDLSVIGNLTFLSLIASLVCFWMWAKAVLEIGTVKATNYIYINPLATIIAAYLLIDERITPTAILGAAAILAGMWIVQKTRN